MALLLTLGACSTSSDPSYVDPGLSSDAEDADEREVLNDDLRADQIRIPLGPVEFDNQCEPGTRVIVGAVGDFLLHGGLQRQAFAQDDHFRTLWAPVEHLLDSVDVMYGNFEGASAPGTTASGGSVNDPGMSFGTSGVYTSYPQFNYHPQLPLDLITAGFDVVSTANNHSLDRRGLGADRTIASLEAAGLPYTGTTHSQRGDQEWWTMTVANGVRIAWLACTYGTNGIPDRNHQVLNCYSDKSEVLDTITRLSTSANVDAVIVTPHWGLEYRGQPEQQEVNLGRAMLEAGATAVIGGHPHVLQPWERHVTSDGREGFIIYSLGNFVSGQSSVAKRSTIFLMLGLTKSSETGRVVVNGVRYVPLYMLQSPLWQVTLADEESDPDGAYRAAYNHITGIFGKDNLISPNALPTTTAECPSDETETPWVPGAPWN